MRCSPRRRLPGPRTFPILVRQTRRAQRTPRLHPEPTCNTCSAPIRGRAGDAPRAASRPHGARSPRWRTRRYPPSASSSSASSDCRGSPGRRARRRHLSDLHRLPRDRVHRNAGRGALEAADVSPFALTRVLYPRLEQRLDHRRGAPQARRLWHRAAAPAAARWRTNSAPVACPRCRSRHRVHQPIRLDSLQGAAPMPRLPGAVRMLQMHLKFHPLKSRPWIAPPRTPCASRWRFLLNCAISSSFTPANTSPCGARSMASRSGAPIRSSPRRAVRCFGSVCASRPAGACRGNSRGGSGPAIPWTWEPRSDGSARRWIRRGPVLCRVRGGQRHHAGALPGDGHPDARAEKPVHVDLRQPQYRPHHVPRGNARPQEPVHRPILGVFRDEPRAPACRAHEWPHRWRQSPGPRARGSRNRVGG